MIPKITGDTQTCLFGNKKVTKEESSGKAVVLVSMDHGLLYLKTIIFCFVVVLTLEG